MEKVYFPNLNGLRFIAALLVFIHHVEQLKDLLGLESYWSNYIILSLGRLGVSLFFVLSGFLITYLLLIEQKQTGTVAIKSFYLRRMVRIWPLYYLIVVLSFFVFPYVPFLSLGEYSLAVLEDLPIKLTLFLLFLPNLALFMYPGVPYASQAWTIGVEEQFYLIWPVLMKWIKNKELLLYTIIIGYWVITFILTIPVEPWVNYYLNYPRKLINSFSIDCMAIGGTFALQLYQKNKILKLLYNQYLQWLIIITLGILIASGTYIPYFHNSVYSLLFGILILNLASNPTTKINLENGLLNFLGKISYGLYMYHYLGIIIALKLLGELEITNIFLQYTLSMLLTIIFAALSYKYLEKYFILKKSRFSKIKSGENALTQDRSVVGLTEVSPFKESIPA